MNPRCHRGTSSLSWRIMWKWWYLCYILLQLCAAQSNLKTALDSPFNLKLYRNLRILAFNIFDRTEKRGGKYLQVLRKSENVQKTVPDYIPFPCNATGGRSRKVPNSVHKLRPGDIDVIAAMGDSYTAGTGIFADNLLHLTVDNRGVTAAGGGQGTWRQYLTLPNILKEFNPNLIGYALGDSLAYHEESQLNVAENGATSQDMPYMAKILVKRIKSDPRINLKKHWKFISLMIGGNNFCTDICWAPSFSILENHKAEMLQVLRTLRDNLPRTFVALIPPPFLEGLVDHNFERSHYVKCHIIRYIACSCMYSLHFQKFKSDYYDIMKRWQKLDVEIANYPEFQRKDFVVVSQPVLMNLSAPLLSDGSYDSSFFSVDCFHLNQKSNSIYANGLWNNLLEPIGAKTSDWKNTTLFKKFLCPTPENPYLTTMLNSRKQLKTVIKAS